MDITINNTIDKLDYFTLTDNVGTEYQWHGRKGIPQDPENVLLLIRRREYPGAVVPSIEDQTPLEAFESWIQAGHTNSEVTEEYQEEISPAVYETKTNVTDPVVDEDGIIIQGEVTWFERVLVSEAVFEPKTRVITPAKLIEKVPWVSTHPTPERIIDGKKISGDTLVEFEVATTVEELRAVMHKILLGEE